MEKVSNMPAGAGRYLNAGKVTNMLTGDTKGLQLTLHLNIFIYVSFGF
jgi:hypothetical protein